ncbi:SDR family NAD(P)-dependent oxidoreductase [Oceanirhabdus sp. W0125-5]|uniref:SDR family NAD(P)-dependent oxidoreductase n=1 Tax=Oceanirhabdus sp. W0125-5 TaxID=2999116 RepID=UPI0022F2BCEF|nr:SDR family NAD(P)-dependent oxidoreductase [Oceanirhabdus sp. W0125-5]WBW96222.1 SDR family NAD(P)-dependent oxidoreductase [Oceanirhabdus sp. W0125-5]
MRSFVVTGVTNGLGNELIRLFHELNIGKLYLLGRKIHRIQSVVKSAKLYEVDFSKLDIDVLEKLMKDVFRKITNNDEVIFINCAGVVNPIEFVENITNDQLLTSFNVNLVWPCMLIKELVKEVQKKNCDFRIINISSGVAYKPLPGWSLYSTSKASINIFLETLAQEKRHYKIVSVDPGVMDTNMQREIRSVEKKDKEFKYLKDFREFKEKNLLVSPKEVANKILMTYVQNWKASNSYEKISMYNEE